MKATPAYRPYIHDVFPVDGSYCPPSHMLPLLSVLPTMFPRAVSAAADRTDATVQSPPSNDAHAVIASERIIGADWQVTVYSEPSMTNTPHAGFVWVSSATTAATWGMDMAHEDLGMACFATWG